MQIRSHIYVYAYASLDRSFARIACAYIRSSVRARTYICASTCIRVSLRLFTRKNANAVSYVRMREFACVRLRVCRRADLIKTQNVFARKIFQHSNALWVQKLSGCTIPRQLSWLGRIKVIQGKGNQSNLT